MQPITAMWLYLTAISVGLLGTGYTIILYGNLRLVLIYYSIAGFCFLIFLTNAIINIRNDYRENLYESVSTLEEQPSAPTLDQLENN